MNPSNELFIECASWGRFKDKCWFYWDGKKECSQFRDDLLSEPKYMDRKLDPEQLINDLLEKK